MEYYLKEQQEKKNMKVFSILITVNNNIKKKRLLAYNFCFGGTVKKLKKYYKARPGLVNMRCNKIDCKCQRSCGDKLNK